jgi:hypothetical protein
VTVLFAVEKFPNPHFSPHCGVAAADGAAGDATHATRPRDSKSAGGRGLR